MSDLDIYDDTENLISSDEHSEDDDDLMNAAISSQNTSKSDNHVAKVSNNKLKEIKLLLKRTKFSTIYKKKSIKWLNNKKKREKCKEYLLNLIKPKMVPLTETVLSGRQALNKDLNKTVYDLQETIDLDDTDVESSPQKDTVLKKDIEIENRREETARVPQKEPVQGPILENDVNPLQTSCNKRPRSPSVENNSCPQSKKFESEKPSNSFYKEINDLFPKYDEIVGKQVKSSNNTVNVIDEHMTRILLDIQTLNDIIQTKEFEWNRLLHLKHVKEEILTRLIRKKHIVELKEKQSDEHKYTLLELKEFEMYLSQPNALSTSNTSSSTAQQLIENRANMRKEDLEKERNNTNRLQSILISSNILPKIDTSDDSFAKDNPIPKSHDSTSAKSQELLQAYQYFGKKVKSNTVHQGAFKDIKCVNNDFDQKIPEVLPRECKKSSVNESISSSIRNLNKSYGVPQQYDINNLSIDPVSYTSGGVNYTPTLEKLLSTSSKRSPSYSQGFKFNNGGQQNYYKLHNANDELCNEISITPVSNDNRYLPKDPKEHKVDLLRSKIKKNLVYLETPEHVHGHRNRKDIGDNAYIEKEIQCCQECKTHEARFVCAGCGNQWYCSRNCQITAWDKHSEICND